MTGKSILTAIIFTITITSCVSTKKYKESIASNTCLQTQKDSLNKLVTKLYNENIFLLAQYLDRQKMLELTNLSKDSIISLTQSLRNDIAELTSQNEDLNDEMTRKNEKVKFLQSSLKTKDSIANILKEKISSALTGFEGNGLTVQQRDGKIYVSLDEKLMFEIGKYKVSAKGTEAIKKLSEVLEKNPDINILIEGHTDNTGTVKVNWKLSTERALAITTILLENDSIDARRVTSAGRGQYSPIDSNKTPEGRARNRRCEIILTPKLAELMKLIEKPTETVR
jgi:chemotaxis protein MotB